MSERPPMSEPVPRLRAVEAFPVEHEGRSCVALRDPAGYTDAIVLLHGPLLVIVSLFDGGHTVADIQAAVMRRHGQLVERRQIEEIAEALDQQGFLDSPGFAGRRAVIDGAFLASPTRPATHAGGAYAGEPGELRAMLDGFFAPPDGPGPIDGARAAEPEGRGQSAAPERRGRSAATERRGQSAATEVRGVIAPHIDFHRGGSAYAWAYRELAERSAADLFVIFGTCHAGMEHPFALTRKDYASPLGDVRVDRDFVDALAKRARQDCFGSELAHRVEHSIELQTVFLRHLYADRRDVSIVPVLASFAHEAMHRGQRPDDDPRVPRFLEALAETMAAGRRRVALIAGADLAHVGPRFGDPEPVGAPELARIEREDVAMLESVAAGDPQAFFESVASDGDRRRICGYSPIYALLRSLGGAIGSVKRYGQWPDPNGVVSFASVVFE
ncbi:MAG: AmmeMemoRadiSam system protein B [Candidatus Rokuibacteriota bacterium]|nr:MAG: AmmeMemoRadiSam system protein B [Candidatus Rokubacteria bacterium]